MLLLFVLAAVWLGGIVWAIRESPALLRRETVLAEFQTDRRPTLVATPPFDRLRDLDWCRLALGGKVVRIYLTHDVEFTMPHAGTYGGMDGTVRSRPGLFLVDTGGVAHEVLGARTLPEGEVENVAHELATALDVPLTWL